MIADERYCVDIANQILASTALLKKANMHILTGHLDSCMKKAAQCPEDFDEKLLEIESIFKKMMR